MVEPPDIHVENRRGERSVQFYDVLVLICDAVSHAYVQFPPLMWFQLF